MSGMTRYLLSRAAFSLFLAALFVAFGAPWWIAVLAGGISLGFFAWAPHSGRYVLNPEQGARGLRRDERGQSIVDKAARNTMVVMAMMLGGITIYYGSIAHGDVPVGLLALAIAVGALVYFISDIWQRRVD